MKQRGTAIKLNNILNNILNIKLNNILWFLLYIGLFVAYFYIIWDFFSRQTISTISMHFGYLDTQENWRALDEFISGGIFFKDYFYQYGWFLLLIQSIPYIIFKGTYLAELISRFLFLPILGVIISFVVGKSILQQKHLIFIFMFLALLFNTNSEYTSIRHLMAELGLAFFILHFIQRKKFLELIAGVIAGIAILTSLEYGIALNITILICFVLSFIPQLKIHKGSFIRFFLAQTIFLAPFLFFFYKSGGVKNYLTYMPDFINSFYYSSPCSGYSFPRFSEIQDIIYAGTSKLMIFNIPLEFLQHFNLYIVFGFYLFIAVNILRDYLHSKSLSNSTLLKAIILIYGVLIYIRTMDNPCVGYFTYSLTPFFLLLTITISEIVSKIRLTKSPNYKILGLLIIATIFSWLILTENTGNIIRYFGKKEIVNTAANSPSLVFNQSVGWYIDKQYSENANQIANFIIKNTTEKDYLYVYPWGPYNNMTRRKAPNSIIDASKFMGSQKNIEITINELESTKPKYIIINLFNNLSIAGWGVKGQTHNRYLSLDDSEGVYFTGIGNEVEKYILENYEVILKNRVAAIMKPRIKPVKIKKQYYQILSVNNFEKENIQLKNMKKTNDSKKYKIINNQSSWEFIFDKPIKARDIEFKVKLDGDIFTKHLSRFWIRASAILDINDDGFANSEPVGTKDWQTIRISLNWLRDINSVKITISDNKGLLWWLKPYQLQIDEIIFYKWE